MGMESKLVRTWVIRKDESKSPIWHGGKEQSLQVSGKKLMYLLTLHNNRRWHSERLEKFSRTSFPTSFYMPRKTNVT